MKIIISLVIGMFLGYTMAVIGPNKILTTTSKGIEKSAKVATKTIDSVNKKIAQ